MYIHFTVQFHTSNAFCLWQVGYALSEYLAMVSVLGKRTLLYPIPTISVTEHQLPTHEETGSPQTPPDRNMPGHAAAHLQGGLGAAARAGLL